MLIISRERLEVPTNCEIGLYIQDQLAGRLFQEQATSFNLPAGNVSLRLKLLPGQAPGCLPGLLAPPAQNITLKAGDVRKLRIAQGPDGMYLKARRTGILKALDLTHRSRLILGATSSGGLPHEWIHHL